MKWWGLGGGILAAGLWLGAGAIAQASNPISDSGEWVMSESSDLTSVTPDLAQASGFASASDVIQGDRLTLNGRNVSAPWVQWTHNGRTHIGIGDGVLVREFGVDLLEGNSLREQVARWFGDSYLPLHFCPRHNQGQTF